MYYGHYHLTSAAERSCVYEIGYECGYDIFGMGALLAAMLLRFVMQVTVKVSPVASITEA